MLDRNETEHKAVEGATPYFMLWFRDESRFYEHSDVGIDYLTRAGGKIYGTYLFNCRLSVNCAEITPSYEMEFYEAVPLSWPEGEEIREVLREDLTGANVGEYEQVRYFHCSDFEKAIQTAIQGDVTGWSGSGEPPAIILVEELSVDAWQEYLDDHGDYRQALNAAILDVREKLDANSRF